MTDWLTNLNVEQICVLIYMVVVGIGYGFETTIGYISAALNNAQTKNNLLGVTMLLGWYFSIAYWFIFKGGE